MPSRLLTSLTTVAAVSMFSFLPVASVHAAPVQLNQAGYSAAIAGMTTVTEDFEGFPSFTMGNPLAIANGGVTDTVGNLLVVRGDDDICSTMTDGCLAGTAIEGTRTFSALPAGTTIWAVTDFIAIWPPNTFEIVVTGNSGVATFIGSGASTFFAFSDPTGLLSVAFTHIGFSADNNRGNYTLDNIVTASAPATVPEPATLSLLGLGLAVLGRRRLLR